MMPETFIAATTLWGSDYPSAVREARSTFKAKFGRNPTVVIVNPGISEEAWQALSEADAWGDKEILSMKIITKRTVPLGEVWVG